MNPSFLRWLLPVLLLSCVAACSTAYYNALEKVGIEKRELLTDRLDAARDAQNDAQEAYLDALTQFRSVVSFDGGELEAVYNKLNSEYEQAQSRANDYSARINSVENVAKALFREWEDELNQYQTPSLKAQSAKQLAETKQRFTAVDRAMRRAERSFQPALSALHDKVLYLKHNLNAAAVGAIRTELVQMEEEADRLRQDVEAANAEAERFLRDYATR